MIGIKVADGGFFPIVAENINAKKRLVLTTAHDGQPSVQIDFYKSSKQSMDDAVYIGTLLLENISKEKQGSVSIELIVSSGENGEFSASAYNIEDPEDKGKHVMAVSLSPMENSKEIDDTNLGYEDAVIHEAATGKYAAVVKRPKLRLLLIIISVAAILAITALCLYFFVFRNKIEAANGFEDKAPVKTVIEQPPVPPPQEALPLVQAEVPAPPPPPPPPPPPVIRASEEPAKEPLPRKRDPAPVSSYNVPDVIPAEGMAYKLRWGDTLWDVSQAFYRTPWRYNYLARYNGIRNADRIIAGRTIRVPPLPK
ncbi:MAG: LysM peptidoglycan-binding domain-containing protein [Spirochaetaceae bacterium]|nr:LysM peptidoglycan-binding domain-containing protein [Spirochaetaceae bacterium]